MSDAGGRAYVTVRGKSTTISRIGDEPVQGKFLVFSFASKLVPTSHQTDAMAREESVVSQLTITMSRSFWNENGMPEGA